MVCSLAMGILDAQKIPVNIDSAVTTKGSVTIKGKLVPYTATAGKMPVWDEDGNAIAGLFYVYYQRSDIKDKSKRPLVFSFNGGPGAASVWMHLGYTGPQRIKISEEGYPVQPYGVEENHSSILDVADIVFVGRSLVPLLVGSASTWRESVLVEFYTYENPMPWLMDMDYRAVRTDQYKYIHWVQHGDELYDVQSDPYETNNLIGDPGMDGVAAELKEELGRLSLDALGLGR